MTRSRRPARPSDTSCRGPHYSPLRPCPSARRLVKVPECLSLKLNLKKPTGDGQPSSMAFPLILLLCACAARAFDFNICGATSALSGYGLYSSVCCGNAFPAYESASKLRGALLASVDDTCTIRGVVGQPLALDLLPYAIYCKRAAVDGTHKQRTSQQRHTKSRWCSISRAIQAWENRYLVPCEECVIFADV